jgi:ATP-binding cassette, subfamily B, bacterial
MSRSKVSYARVFSLILEVASGYPFAKFLIIFAPVTWALNFSLAPFFQKAFLKAVFTGASVFFPIFFAILWMSFMLLVFRLYDVFVMREAYPKISSSIELRLFSSLLGKDAEFYQSKLGGALVNKITSSTRQIKPLIDAFSWGFLRTFLMAVINTIALMSVSGPVAVIFFFWVACFALAAFFYSDKITTLTEEFESISAKNTGLMVDTIACIKTVHFFNGEGRELEAARLSSERQISALQNLESTFAKVWGIYKILMIVCYALTLCVMSYQARIGLLRPHDFIFIFGANSMVAMVLWQLVWDFSNFMRAVAYIWAAIETIDNHNWLAASLADGLPLLIGDRKIEFRDISFTYPTARKPIFKNLSLLIEPGQKVGLVGPSGAGKTTLINLLLRNFNVNSGQILIDDQDIGKVSLTSLRNNISVIEQDPILFNRTVEQNVAYGRPNADRADIVRACELACADNFIRRLPKAYQTYVGERGSKLSGGQRQRISIARAILENAPIIILDEATNQLDTIVEREIQQALNYAMRHKTVISIAHKFSTIEGMDRIVVLQGGVIVQDGSPLELKNQPGLYQSLLQAEEESYFDVKTEL